MVVAMKREGQNGGSVGGGSSKFFDHARVYAFTDASTQTLLTRALAFPSAGAFSSAVAVRSPPWRHWGVGTPAWSQTMSAQ
jgi:hypothetical protein